MAGSLHILSKHGSPGFKLVVAFLGHSTFIDSFYGFVTKMYKFPYNDASLLIFTLYSAKIFFIIFRKEILLYEIQEGIEQ